MFNISIYSIYLFIVSIYLQSYLFRYIYNPAIVSVYFQYLPTYLPYLYDQIYLIFIICLLSIYLISLSIYHIYLWYLPVYSFCLSSYSIYLFTLSIQIYIYPFIFSLCLQYLPDFLHYLYICLPASYSSCSVM